MYVNIQNKCFDHVNIVLDFPECYLNISNSKTVSDLLELLHEQISTEKLLWSETTSDKSVSSPH